MNLENYMEIIKDKSIIFVALFFIIVLFENCKVPCTNWERNTMKLHEDFKDGLLEYTTLNSEEMLSHFPIRECDKKYFWSVRYFIPYKTINNYGAYYLEKTFYKEIDSVLSKFTFKSSIVYNSSNVFKIRHFKINDTTSYAKFYQYDSRVLTNYPIPTFYDVDFGLGESLDYIDSTQDWLSIPDSIRMPIFEAEKSNIPNDLVVYIIDAKQGYFWKETNKPLRPPSLRDWKFGFSRGIAISKEKEIICYWFMVW